MNNDGMTVLAVGLVLLVFLLGIRSLKLIPSNMSLYELKRRARLGNTEAEKQLRREELSHDIRALSQALEIILTVLVVLCFLYGFGWMLGSLLSLAALLATNVFANLKPVSTLAAKLYYRYEPHIQNSAQDMRPVLCFMPGNEIAKNDSNLSSKEEAKHFISQTKEILSENERKLLISGLQFENELVSEVMMPAKSAKTVKDSEMLGAVTLDRLHKSGHSFFPVIKRDINHIVGLLCLEDGLSQIKHSTTSTAANLMQPKVFYLNQNETLPGALAAFLRTGAPLFIVVDAHEKTTGIITISDIIKALVGREITDKFDQYEDLRAVANRAATPRRKSDTSAT